MEANRPALWRYRYTDQWGKRQTTRYGLTEQEAMERYGVGAEKVDGSRFEPPELGATSGFRPK